MHPIENFLPTSPVESSDSPGLAIEAVSGRDAVRLIAIGSRHSVLSVIYALHRLHFAQVGDWSPLLPAPTPGEVMSILTRYVSAQPD